MSGDGNGDGDGDEDARDNGPRPERDPHAAEAGLSSDTHDPSAEADAETEHGSPAGEPAEVTGGAGGPSSVCSDPADAMALLGDETRLAILRALAESRRTNWRFEGLPFADLRRAVGMRDSGQFNEHLDKLLGEFVVEHDGEYVLTNRGMAVVGALEPGTYTATGDPRRTDTDYECIHPDCAQQLEAVYQQ